VLKGCVLSCAYFVDETQGSAPGRFANRQATTIQLTINQRRQGACLQAPASNVAARGPSDQLKALSLSLTTQSLGKHRSGMALTENCLVTGKGIPAQPPVDMT
jgi:hypothetical protein